MKATGRNITYSICPFIAGCDESIWSYYKDWSHMSMNQCPEHDATDSWSSFLWCVLMICCPFPIEIGPSERNAQLNVSLANAIVTFQ